MAETLLRHLAGDRFNAYSAGTEPKGINPIAEKVLHEIGVDTSGVRSKHVNEYLGKVPFHYVIVVCDHANDACPRVWPGALQRLFWPFEDPPAFPGTEQEKLEKFREIRDQIRDRLSAWVAELPLPTD
jgi:arsenate reductase